MKPHTIKKLKNTGRRVVSIKFDLVSKMHRFSRSCIVESYKAAGVSRPRMVYSSLPKVMGKLYTKRSVLSKVRNVIKEK